MFTLLEGLPHVCYGEKAFLVIPFFVAVTRKFRRPNPLLALEAPVRKLGGKLDPGNPDFPGQAHLKT